MALTKISRGLLDTGVSDSSDATAITIDSSENVGIGGAADTAKFQVNQNTDNAYIAKFDQDHATGWGVLIDTDATAQGDPALWVKNASDTILWSGSSGRLGVHCIPSTELHVQGDGGSSTIRMDSADIPRNNFIACTNHDDITIAADEDNQGSSSKIVFKVDGSAHSRFDANQFLIGRTGGSIGAEEQGLVLNKSGYIYCARDGSGSATVLGFARKTDTTAVTVGSITTSGTATAYNTSSDYRLKENVVTDWDATTRLKQLKPSRFNFIDDADTTVDGFLAHEVSDIVPEAITGEKDATETYTDDEGNEQTRPIYQAIDQSKLVPLLVKTIQELEARITTLENS